MIYTLGFMHLQVETFVDILKQHNITFVIDIRSYPTSRHYFLYNDYNISRTLKKHGIKYENWPEEFGEEQDDIAYFSDGVLDFDKFVKSDQFLFGMDLLRTLKDQNICLICFETDPIYCHRGLVIGKEIKNAGMDLLHIIAMEGKETRYETQTELEQRLLKTSKIKNLDEAYRRKNKDIIFSPRL